jgi:hypothetical protein
MNIDVRLNKDLSPQVWYNLLADSSRGIVLVHHYSTFYYRWGTYKALNEIGETKLSWPFIKL